MPVINAGLLCITQSLIATDGFLQEPPVCWLSTAEQWNAESGTNIGGRYDETTGQLVSAPVWKLQDTYLNGTGSRTGRAFDSVSGTWKDDAVSVQTDKYYLLMPDSTADTTFEITSHDTTTGIEPAGFILHFGDPPAASSTAHAAATRYMYLHLGYTSTDKIDYRLNFTYGKPIALDFTKDGGTTWSSGIAIARRLGNLENYLQANNNQIRIEVRLIKLKKDKGKQRTKLRIEIGEGNWVTETNPDNDVPATGKIRLIGKNGFAGLEYYPLRFPAITVAKSKRDFGRQLRNLPNATVSSNGLTATDSTQTVTPTINSNDGQVVTWNTTAATPDDGTGTGGTAEPRLSDITIYLPEQFGFTVDGTPEPSGFTYLRDMQAQITQTWNDEARTLTTSAVVVANNIWSDYVGAIGRQAIQLWTSNGYNNACKLQGIAGVNANGLEIFRQDPTRLFTLVCADPSYRMMQQTGQEVILDGWCLFSAVRFLCAGSGTWPDIFCQTIPNYIRPDGTPYGVAGDDCVYPVLKQGTGLNAAYKFGPEMTWWGILQILVQDSFVDPITGIGLPYYMGFDMRDIPTYGWPQFRFEPFDPMNMNITAFFADRSVQANGGVGGQWVQVEEIRVFNSIENLRSEIVLQGLDAWTNEVLNLYLPTPTIVSQVMGFRVPMVDRSPRYTSQEYIEQVGGMAVQVASMPTQVVWVKAPHLPELSAGDVFMVSSWETGTAPFVCTEVRSVLGVSSLTGDSNTKVCDMQVIGRSLNGYPSAKG